jgi:hypothetical protein
MTVFPKQVPNHSGKYLPVRKWPIRSRQTGVVTGYICSGNYEKERRARHKNGEAVNTFGHRRLPIADCRLPIMSDSPITRKSAIGNRKSAIC